MSAAVSPVMRLRFAVTTKPACENKRFDAADEAWTARYTCEPAWQCGGTASRSAFTTREGRPGAALSLP